jgi:hypothetical protein
MSCRRSESKGDPAGGSLPRRLPDCPRLAEHLERKSAGKLKRAFLFSVRKGFQKACRIETYSKVNEGEMYI